MCPSPLLFFIFDDNLRLHKHTHKALGDTHGNISYNYLYKYQGLAVQNKKLLHIDDLHIYNTHKAPEQGIPLHNFPRSRHNNCTRRNYHNEAYNSRKL